MIKKSKQPLANKLLFQGKVAPLALSSLLAFGGGGASVYYALEDYYPVIQAQKNITFQACFTPRNQCQPLLISAIDKAQHSIYVQNYSFTAKSLAMALVMAHARGVKVNVISDKGQRQVRSVISYLKEAGIPVFLDEKVAIAHNKVLIIDEQYVITGSYNFSTIAETRNAENLLIIGSPDLAYQYLENWQERLKESVPLS